MSVVSWTARTKSLKDAGSVNIGNIDKASSGTLDAGPAGSAIPADPIGEDAARRRFAAVASLTAFLCNRPLRPGSRDMRSEEHTSELQSHVNLVCRLLLEKKK